MKFIWTHLFFVLLKTDCGKNVTIPNGQANFTNVQTTYKQSVPVNCVTGYELTGGTTIECLADGTWSKTTTCEIIGLYSICYILYLLVLYNIAIDLAFIIKGCVERL